MDKDKENLDHNRIIMDSILKCALNDLIGVHKMTPPTGKTFKLNADGTANVGTFPGGKKPYYGTSSSTTTSSSTSTTTTSTTTTGGGGAGGFSYTISTGGYSYPEIYVNPSHISIKSDICYEDLLVNYKNTIDCIKENFPANKPIYYDGMDTIVEIAAIDIQGKKISKEKLIYLYSNCNVLSNSSTYTLLKETSLDCIHRKILGKHIIFHEKGKEHIYEFKIDAVLDDYLQNYCKYSLKENQVSEKDIILEDYL